MVLLVSFFLDFADFLPQSLDFAVKLVSLLDVLVYFFVGLVKLLF
jgi:hypothetical protein